MAQFAVHVATGLYSGFKGTEKSALRYALLAGNIIPDLDFIPMLLLYPFFPDFALSLHRTMTHNIFFPLLVLAILWIIAKVKKNSKILDWGIGLAIGISTHILFDILFWFDQVQIMWPLDLFGISTEVDLWKSLGVSVPDIVLLFISPTAEFLMYVLFYFFLGRYLYEINTERQRLFFRSMVVISLVVYLGLVISIFVLTPRQVVEWTYGLASPIWGPITIMVAWRRKDDIYKSWSKKA